MYVYICIYVCVYISGPFLIINDGKNDLFSSAMAPLELDNTHACTCEPTNAQAAISQYDRECCTADPSSSTTTPRKHVPTVIPHTPGFQRDVAGLFLNIKRPPFSPTAPQSRLVSVEQVTKAWSMPHIFVALRHCLATGRTAIAQVPHTICGARMREAPPKDEASQLHQRTPKNNVRTGHDTRKPYSRRPLAKLRAHPRHSTPSYVGVSIAGAHSEDALSRAQMRWSLPSNSRRRAHTNVRVGPTPSLHPQDPPTPGSSASLPYPLGLRFYFLRDCHSWIPLFAPPTSGLVIGFLVDGAPIGVGQQHVDHLLSCRWRSNRGWSAACRSLVATDFHQRLCKVAQHVGETLTGAYTCFPRVMHSPPKQIHGFWGRRDGRSAPSNFVCQQPCDTRAWSFHQDEMLLDHCVYRVTQNLGPVFAHN